MSRTRWNRMRGGWVGVVILAAAAAMPGCSSSGQESTALSEQPARMFEGMGTHTRTITTNSPKAQAYFNQGLTWAFAFNHDEAIRSFKEVARLDPDCAMAWWGVALCNGPHINNASMDEAHSQAAWDALQKAVALKDKASPTERALIDALSKRYAMPIPEDRKPLDEAYAAAMRRVWRANPTDADIGTLCAESLMDLHPWDLWAKDGSPKVDTQEIVATLEKVMEIDPVHPGANHLYIHAVEASPQPERGVASADRLRTLVPGSGHLVHMPAHIDVRMGDWTQAATSNERAMVVDAAYRKLSPRQGFYNLYMAHNPHFLSWTAMMEGRKTAALEAARTMIAEMPESFVRDQPALADPPSTLVLDVMKRFGEWDMILAEPAPPGNLPISTAMWHNMRALAFAAKGKMGDAEQEQAEFKKAVRKVPEDAHMAINPAHKVLDIADHMLEGEMAFRRGKIDESVAELKKAIAIEDDLLYMEPPDWIQPVRHTLGAVLVSAGRYSEAEEVYKQDLKYWPKNGWALLGLKQCQEARGETDAAQKTGEMLKAAWKRADIKPGTSCMCVDGEKQ